MCDLRHSAVAGQRPASSLAYAVACGSVGQVAVCGSDPQILSPQNSASASVAIAVKTAQCHWKLQYVPKFTAASRGTPCDSVASCLKIFYRKRR